MFSIFYSSNIIDKLKFLNDRHAERQVKNNVMYYLLTEGIKTFLQLLILISVFHLLAELIGLYLVFNPLTIKKGR